MHHLAQIAPTILDTNPAWQIGLGACVLAGVVLWLLGGRLARPGCALVGLVVGTGAAALLTYNELSPTVTLLVIIGAGIAGCLVAYLLFRIWMGLSCAVILMLAASAVSVGVVSDEPPTVEQMKVNLKPAEKADAEELPSPTIELEAGDDKPKPTETLAPGAAEAQAAARNVLARTKAVVTNEWSEYREWWSRQNASTQRTTAAVAGIAAAIGLLGGLIFPYFAASVQSALCGAALMTLAGLELIKLNTEPTPAWLPHTAFQIALAISLITALGLALQWTVLRRKADK